MPASDVAALLAAYGVWYREKYIPKMIREGDFDGIEDFEENDWEDALKGLRKLKPADVDRIENKHGSVPRPYRELVRRVGVGPILCAYDEEPIPFHILRPTELEKTRKAALSWLSKADAKLAKDELGLDPAKMLPFMTDDGQGYYFMMTRQSKDDDRVVIFDHAYEQGHPFGRTKPFSKFVERWIACAKKGEPLNPFGGL